MAKRKYFEYFLLVVAIVAAFGLINSLRAEPLTHQSTLSTHVDPPAPTAPTASELLALTNIERSKAGVAPLVLDERLNVSAQAKADEIKATGVFEHVGATGKHGYEYMTVDQGVRCVWGGENLGQGLTAKETVDGLMGSPPHRAAILNPGVEVIGFGVSRGSYYYNTVEHLCNLP
jgi:uncharacterized protein YkwD